MMSYDYQVAVIGGGSAGLSVAAGAAGVGLRVALIEDHNMGGDCLNAGCVPSKAFIQAARSGRYTAQTAMTYVNESIARIAQHDSVERFTSLGVEVILGQGALVGPHTVQIADRQLTARFIVLATGSKPSIPPLPGLAAVDYLTNETFFKLDGLPRSVVVLGAGPIGLELGQAMAMLGVKVTLLDRLPDVFMKDDLGVRPIMRHALESSGVDLQLEASILRIEKTPQGDSRVVYNRYGKEQSVEAERILVAAGRIPDTHALNLQAVGVSLDQHGYVRTDAALRTTVSHIYACGDIVGPYPFTHMAAYQAGIVLKNMILPIKRTVCYDNLTWCTFTTPEVAQVGDTEQTARSKKKYHRHFVIDLAEIDRAIIQQDRGFCKVVLDRRNRILGVTIVSAHAADLLSQALVAVNKKLRLSDFISIIYPYPSTGEMFKTLAYQQAKLALKPWLKVLISKLV